MQERGLSTEQKQKFDQDGYLVLPNFFSKEKAYELKQRTEQLLQSFSLEDHPMTKFDSSGNVGDDYFLNSGDKIRFFFEPEAFNDKGNLTRDKAKAINKIGHALHVLDPAFKEFTINDNVRQIAKDLGLIAPRVLQSMVILKQPHIGGSVPVHVDSTFLYTKPLSAHGFWFALEDCSESNGCLWFLPGSHKFTPVKKRFVRSSEGHGTTFEGEDCVEIDHSKFAKVECRAGTLVLIHGSVVHKSEANRSHNSRYIYSFHVIDGSAEYDAKNWLQPTPEMPFTPL